MTRAYLRLDPSAFERKAIQQGYSLAEFAAFVGVLCLAEIQPERGRFRDERLLRALLGPAGRHLAALIAKGDLVPCGGGRLYVDGWDEWQEGDVTVRDRMARLRARHGNGSDRNVRDGADRNSDRHTPSAGHSGGIAGHIPPPPTSGGRRSDGTNPRANGHAPREEGTNPRALGTSSRQERTAQKRGPSALHEILTAIQRGEAD